MTQAERIAELRQSDPFMSVREVAAYLTLATSTIHRMTREGNLPAPTRIGKKTIRWRRSEIDKWLEECNRPTLKSV